LVRLQGAKLTFALLQGAFLGVSRLEGASFHKASLQGVAFTGVTMDSTVLDGAWVWRAKIMNLPQRDVSPFLRAKIASCGKFRSKDRKLDQIIAASIALLNNEDVKSVPATSVNITNFIDRAVAGIPNTAKRKLAAANLHNSLDVDPANDDTAAISKAWIDCEAKGGDVSDETFDKSRAVVLRNLVCESTDDREAIAAGIIRNWISDPEDDPTVLSIALARGLLGQDGVACAAAKDFDRTTMTNLRAAAARTVRPPAPSQ
jgi:Pentapeptide repeats (8 copies)